MKKKPTTNEGITYHERCRRKHERRRTDTTDKHRKRNRRDNNDRLKWTSEEKTEKGEILVRIGERLDPMEQGTETIEACRKIRNINHDGNNSLYVDLSDMKEFSLAGVILLSSSVKIDTPKPLRRPTEVRGNLPNDEDVASNFLASGFFDSFRQKGLQLPPPKAAWTSANERKVVAAKAATLVDFAESHVSMDKAQRNAIWQNLVECMTNTHNHAKGTEVPIRSHLANRNRWEHEEWIAGVMCNDGIAYFSFVDQGVGICASVGAQGWLVRLGQSLIRYGPEKLVKDAFEGKLGSSTKAKGRGLGLPRMTHDAQRGLLLDLRVRTGKVEGNVETMVFRQTREHLHGTVFTWTIPGSGGRHNEIAHDEQNEITSRSKIQETR